MSLIGKQIGNYHIKAKLGEGGMGAVYLGEHPLIGKRVAVKVLLEELAAKEDIVTRFFNEAKAVNDIGHQNIVDIVDFGKIKNEVGGDTVYFIMEFLDGDSLAERLRRTGLEFKETLHIMMQCCSALAASHAKGIVHRDLKPENLYLCTRGTDKNFAKILDFGIAKLTGDGGTSSHKTRTGLVIGTPTYMSPEQCEGKGLIDARSDIYSLGVVMYELLTGRVPFPGEGFGEILVAHLTKEPEAPSKLNPDITPELEAIVMHAIEKDRNRRFQTMEEFGAAIADTAAHFASYKQLPGYTSAASSSPGVSAATQMHAVGAQVTGHGPAVTTQSPRPTTLSGSAAEVEGVIVRRSRAPVFIGVGALVALVAGVAVFASGRKPPVPLATGSSPPSVAGAGPTGIGGAPGSAGSGAAVPPPVAPPTAETFKVTLTSEPTGADVVRSGKVLGVTPFELTVKKGDPSFEVELRKAGFDTQQRTVETDQSHEFYVALKAVAKATPVVSKKSSSDGKKSHRGEAKTRTPGDDMGIMRPSEF